jgi:uncharacterized Tic20 family protein
MELPKNRTFLYSLFALVAAFSPFIGIIVLTIFYFTQTTRPAEDTEIFKKNLNFLISVTLYTYVIVFLPLIMIRLFPFIPFPFGRIFYLGIAISVIKAGILIYNAVVTYQNREPIFPLSIDFSALAAKLKK